MLKEITSQLILPIIVPVLIYILAVVLTIWLHELGHLAAYKLCGIKNPIITGIGKGIRRFYCVTVVEEDVVKFYSDFFERKGKDAWKYQVFISLPGVIMNVSLVVVCIIYYFYSRQSFEWWVVHLLHIAFIFVSMINVIENILTHGSDGQKKLFNHISSKKDIVAIM